MNENLISNIKILYAINKNSEKIFEKKEFVLIGISPFNGYFNFNNVYALIEWSYLNFKSFKIILPGEISYYTLTALGHDENYVKYKIHKQSNYIKNKILKSFDIINKKYSVNLNSNRIIEISDLILNVNFKKIYEKCKNLFDTDIDFRNNALNTSKEILNSYGDKYKIENIEKSTLIAVNYLLYELPIYLDAPTILNIKSCIIVYHYTPKFIEELYNNTNLVAPNQGYMNLLLDVRASNKSNLNLDQEFET